MSECDLRLLEFSTQIPTHNDSHTRLQLEIGWHLMWNNIHIRTDAGIAKRFAGNGGKPNQMYCEILEGYTRPRSCTRMKKGLARTGHEYCQSNMPQALFDLMKGTFQRQRVSHTVAMRLRDGSSNHRIVTVTTADGKQRVEIV